jgi:hypothetical protein
MGVCMDVVKNRDFRQAVLRIIVKLYKQDTHPDYIRIVQCLIFLDDSEAVVHVLSPLLALFSPFPPVAFIEFNSLQNKTKTTPSKK